MHWPYFAYAHSEKVVPGETCPSGSTSISGVAFYQGGPYPASYENALFFSDYSRDCIWAMPRGADGLPDISAPLTFVAAAEGPVALEIGPGGDLFYADFDGGTIRRIRYFAANQPPIAIAHATPASGAAPLHVSFDGTGSSDPEGGALAFAWDLDGDGEFDDSTSPTPSFTYTEEGAISVRLRVTDTEGASGTDTVVVQVGNTAPVATIVAPVAGTTWAVGEDIVFSGTGMDAEEGQLPPSAFSWRLVLHHCPSNCHEHPLQEYPGVVGGVFDAPDHEYPSHLELRLSVTDSGGLKHDVSVLLPAKTVELTFATSPPGLELTVDDETGTAPFARTVIQGSTHTVSAPPTQVLGGVQYDFLSWSHGAPRVHALVSDADGTYVASYAGGSPPAESCAYDPGTKTVTAETAYGSKSTLAVLPSGELRFGVVPASCGGATRTNTDTIVVLGAVGGKETLVLDQTGGPLAPGATPEPSGLSEIEVVADLGDAFDRVAVTGTSADETLAVGAAGIGFNGDNDTDVTFGSSPPPATVELAGGGGRNVLTGRGGTGTGSVFTGSVILRAGSLGDQLTGTNQDDVIIGGAGPDTVNGYPGDDVIIGGGGDDKLAGSDGNDDITGGAGADSITGAYGDDTIRAADGETDAQINGGPGVDTAYYDPVDPSPTAVENRILQTDPPPPPPPDPDPPPPDPDPDPDPPPPSEGTCAYEAGSKSVTIEIGVGGSAVLAVVGDEIRFGATACGAATTANTDTITANGPPGSVERLVVDQPGGPLSPGATPETTGVSEIELAVNLGDAADEFVLHGTAGPDVLVAGVKGVSFTGDTDLDVTFATLPLAVELVGGDGDDVLSARGGYGAAQVFTGRVTLRGGDGAETLSGGNLADLIVGGAGPDTIDGGTGDDVIHGDAGGDKILGQDGDDTIVRGPGPDTLNGGNGNDTLVATDGEADVQIHGQGGTDTAYYDAGVDPAAISAETAIPGPPPLVALDSLALLFPGA